MGFVTRQLIYEQGCCGKNKISVAMGVDEEEISTRGCNVKRSGLRTELSSENSGWLPEDVVVDAELARCMEEGNWLDGG